MSSGDRAVRVDVRGADELAALARAFNVMAEGLDREERRKRELTNDIAHELRTPVTNLRCHLEALQDGVAPFTAGTARALHADVVHLQRLVDDLGELAQVEARELRLEPERTDLSTVVEHLARELEPRLASAGLTLERRTEGRVQAWVDPERLRQVLRNLVENAVAHTPAGGRIEIELTADESSASIGVSDTGEGIAAQHLPRVFDRFYRADPARSRRTGGAGLGLAIARQIVVQSGGDIAVVSEPGRSTTFTVRVPREAPSQLLHNSDV